MAFCTNCGSQVSDMARFCTTCGKPVSNSPATIAPPSYIPDPSSQPLPVAFDPLDYTIQGDNLQIIRIKLKPCQELYAEAGKMVYKQPQVSWETRMSGQSLGEKLIGAVKRKMMGESLFLTYFRTNIPGEVGFAGSYPGRIQAFELRAGQSVFVQRDSFLVAQSSAQLNIAFVRKLGAGFFGGEGFVLEKLTGPGAVFIHAGGDFIEFELAAGEVLQVDTGSIVAFDETVDYDIQLAGGVRTALFGGEGFFLATLRGPGRVIIQSMTLAKMRRELAPYAIGGEESHGLGAIASIFNSND